jgi:hypothetical protein
VGSDYWFDGAPFPADYANRSGGDFGDDSAHAASVLGADGGVNYGRADCRYFADLLIFTRFICRLV